MGQTKLMQGRSHYRFPTHEVFEKRLDNEVEQLMEAEVEAMYGLGQFYALAMVNKTKAAIPVDPVNPAI